MFVEVRESYYSYQNGDMAIDTQLKLQTLHVILLNREKHLIRRESCQGSCP